MGDTIATVSSRIAGLFTHAVKDEAVKSAAKGCIEGPIKVAVDDYKKAAEELKVITGIEDKYEQTRQLIKLSMLGFHGSHNRAILDMALDKALALNDGVTILQAGIDDFLSDTFGIEDLPEPQGCYLLRDAVLPALLSAKDYTNAIRVAEKIALYSAGDTSFEYIVRNLMQDNKREDALKIIKEKRLDASGSAFYLCNIADDLIESGNPSEARTVLMEALPYARKVANYSPQYLARVGSTMTLAGDYLSAYGVTNEVKELCRGKVGVSGSNDCHIKVAEEYSQRGLFGTATELLDYAVAEAEKLDTNGDEEAVRHQYVVLYSAAILFTGMGQLDKAIEVANKISSVW